jgi:hypothetical protein
VDLARKLAPVRWSPQAQGADGMEPLVTPIRAIAFVPGEPSGPASRDLKAPRTSEFGVPYSRDVPNAVPATGRRSGRWTRTALALAPAGAALLFGAALFVAVFGPKGSSTGARSPMTRPALVKIISSEERPTDLHVAASSAATPTSASSEPSPAGVAPPTSLELPATAPVAALRPAV